MPGKDQLACQSKRQFATTKRASREANRLRDTEGIDLLIYKCPWCNKYHFTSNRPMVEQRSRLND